MIAYAVYHPAIGYVTFDTGTGCTGTPQPNPAALSPTPKLARKRVDLRRRAIYTNGYRDELQAADMQIHEVEVTCTFRRVV